MGKQNIIKWEFNYILSIGKIINWSKLQFKNNIQKNLVCMFFFYQFIVEPLFDRGPCSFIICMIRHSSSIFPIGLIYLKASFMPWLNVILTFILVH